MTTLQNGWTIDDAGHCEIPQGVTSIGNYAFYGCTGLTSVTIPDSVTSIGYCAFDGCTSLTSVTIPDSVTSIEYCAFYGCTGLTSVTIPDGVTSIGNYAFYGYTSLTSVTLAHHTALHIGGSRWQVGCRCARLEWWAGVDGKAFALKNFYTDDEYNQAIAAMTARGAQ